MFKFPNNDFNRFIFLLRKGIILMNICMLGKRLMRQHSLKKKNYDLYHDLYLRSDVLLLANVFKKC